MTIFELFPFFIAIGVAAVAGSLLANKTGLSTVWVWTIAALLGIASIGANRLTLGKLASWLDQRKWRKEKWERENRKYREFDAAKTYVGEKNLYYQCLTCGNAIPTMPKKDVTCKCGNITVDASGRLTVQNQEKIKLFSAPRQR
ncbi:hypothetical protein Cflav_PD4368 [Pedosphaera parvula Ellin514]|uniref:Uncharacterized protein n=1 Tax=Pedosphaera parvula (strain Ellin514) TaxID=320771 RepID=B9XFI3_PEDPL|nr:hypothetical protein Cflav_PD4368 [Pedosphaera parvula Ellin514]